MIPNPRNEAERALASLQPPSAHSPAAISPPRQGPAPHSLRYAVDTFVEYGWTIAGIAVLVFGLSLGYLAFATPMYEARVVVQVEDTRKTLAGLEAVSDLFGEKHPAETEIAIMRSQVILGSVISQLNLDIEAAPQTRFTDRLLRRGTGASIEVRELRVPDALVDRRLILTAQENRRFELATAEGTRLAEGTVGAVATGPDVADEERLRIVVADLAAPPGTRFVLVRRDFASVAEELRKQLRIVEVGKATGILDISYASPDPQRVSSVLNAFASAYLRQNVERKSAEAEKTLEFLDAQLPVLKRRVEQAESALEQFQTANGSIGLSRRTESMLTRTVDVEKELSELELQRTEIKQRFTDNHPSVIALDRKIDQLKAKQASVTGTMRQIPAAELELARLTRDQRVASQVYDLLLNKAQELRILRSGIVGNVRILDRATPPRRPASPRPIPVLLLGAVLGVAAGVAVAFVRRSLDEGADDPDAIEERTGLPVYVTIPHAPRQAKIAARASRSGGAMTPLMTVDPGEPAIEALRSLRTALQFALAESSSNVITISSPAPSVGKTFVATNLALLLADSGRTVLLVDADLRRGRLHRYFGLTRDPGLSSVLAGITPMDVAIQRTATESRVSVLPTGKIPPNPAELLASSRFAQLIATVSPRFDFVLVDTPPVLAVTDATLAARCSGVNLLVLRAGQHPYREIVAAIRQFTQNGFPVQGGILNDATSRKHGYGRYGRYYEYRSEGR